MTKVPVLEIWSEGNIRIDENDVTELATSISRQGLIAPISVIERDNGKGGKYLLLAGHRRLAAVKSLHQDMIDVVFNTTVETVADRLSIQYAENVQRKNLSAYEQMQVALDLKAENMTQGDVAMELGISKDRVSKYQKAARLINTLPNADDATKLSEQALFDLAETEVESEDVALVTENALRAIVSGQARSVGEAFGNAEREARDVRILEHLEPLIKELHDIGVTFATEQMRGSVPLVVHSLASNYGNLLGFDEKAVVLHRQLACHVVHMGKGWSGPTLSEYCIKPASHREKGKSGLKEASAEDKQQQRVDERADRKALKDAKQARKDRAAAVLSGKWTQKQAIELIRSTVRLGSDANRVASGALGLEVIKSEYGDYRDYSTEVHGWIESLPKTKQDLAPIMVLAAYMYVEDLVGVKGTPVFDLFTEEA